MQKTIKLLSLFCSIILLATTNLHALYENMRIFKRVEDGKTYYLYCLSDRHGTALLKQASNLVKYFPHLRPLVVEQQEPFIDALNNCSKRQGDALSQFIRKLNPNSFLLIDEDMGSYTGDNPLFSKYAKEVRVSHFMAGIFDSSALTTHLFEQCKWPIRNAECRFYNEELAKKKAIGGIGWDSDYKNTVNQLTDEAEKLIAPETLKKFVGQCLADVKDEFVKWAMYPIPYNVPLVANGLVNARMTILIWQNRQTPHIFVSCGKDHVDHIVPELPHLGYEELFVVDNMLEKETKPGLEDLANDREKVIHYHMKKLSPEFLQKNGINLADAFNSFIQQEDLRLTSNTIQESKEKFIELPDTPLVKSIKLLNKLTPDVEQLVSLLNALTGLKKSITSDQKLVETNNSACGNCKAKDAPLRCTQCKSTNYCNKECQQAHWKTHKKTCKMLAASFKSPPNS